MRIYYYIIFLGLLISCGEKSSNEIKQSNEFTFDNLIGKWQVNSSTYDKSNYSDIYITDTGAFYYFSHYDGGGMDYKGLIKGDSVSTQYDMSFYINQTDSNLIELTQGFSGENLFLRRKEYGPFMDDLRNAIKADSLRKKLLGFWKMVNIKEFIKLPNNSSKSLSTFTLQIREDGKAVFYRDHQLDSNVNYSYSIYDNSINLSHGCVVSRLNIISINNDSLTLFNSRLSFNELKLYRITEFD